VVETTSDEPIDQRVRLLRADALSGRVTRFAIVLGLVSVVGSGLVGYSAFTTSRQAIFDSIAHSNLLTARDLSQHLRDGQFTAFTPDALELVEHEWSARRHDSEEYFACVIDWDGRLVLHTGQPELIGVNVRDTLLGMREPSTAPRSVADLLGTNDEWSGLNRRLNGEEQIAAYVAVKPTGGIVVVHATKQGLDELVFQTMLPWWAAFGVLTLVLIPVSLTLLHRSYQAAHHRSEEAIDELCGSLDFQRLLLSELDHRVRNNLASLKSLIDISRTNHSDVSAYSSTIKGRIQAMAEVHTLLSASRWTSVNLPSLLERLVPDSYRSAVKSGGGDVLIPARQAGAVGMVLHELITNSIKHGSLASPEGRVEITWTAEPLVPNDADSPTAVQLSWHESGGPPVAAPADTGIGSSLVRGLVESELRGRATLDFPPSGAHHQFTIHLDSASETTADILTPAPGSVSLRSPII
jgi:two-component sensor histidine kinase